MKRKRYLVLTAASAILLCLFVKELTEIPALLDNPVRRTETDSDFSAVVKEAVPAADFSEETEPWRKAYAEILHGSGAEMFSFCFVDGDEIPELVLHISKDFTHGNGDVALYTYYNKEAVMLGDKFCCDGYSNFLYTPKKGYVVSGFFNEEYGAFEVFQLENGEMRSLHTFDEYQRDEPEYHIDNRIVPFWEYRRIFYRYTKGNVNDYGDYDLTEENIRKTLNY